MLCLLVLTQNPFSSFWILHYSDKIPFKFCIHALPDSSHFVPMLYSLRLSLCQFLPPISLFNSSDLYFGRVVSAWFDDLSFLLLCVFLFCLSLFFHYWLAARIPWRNAIWFRVFLFEVSVWTHGYVSVVFCFVFRRGFFVCVCQSCTKPFWSFK